MSIVFDAILGRRYQKPRCNPGNKNCGQRCIPQDYSCGSEEEKGDHPRTAETLARVEEGIRNQRIEYAVVIDPKTGRELLRYSGDQTSVDIPPHEWPKLKGAILTHNHPNIGGWPKEDPRGKGFSFSPQDIHAANSLRIREIRAVSSGYNHSMVMPKGMINVDGGINKHAPGIYRGLAWEVFTGKMDSRQAETEYWHRLWTKVAADNPGMIYKRTEVKMDTAATPRRKDVQIRSQVLRNRYDRVDAGIPSSPIKVDVDTLVRTLLSRSYGPSIKAIRIESIRDGKIVGRFSDRTRIMEFLISERGVSTRMIQDLIKRDSGQILHSSTLNEEDDRFDAGSSKKGIKCGKSWISARKTCQIGINQISTPSERKQLALILSSPRSTAIGRLASPEDDVNATIRELQAEAQAQKIPYANRMTKEQLRDVLRAYKSSPQEREATYKALSRKKQAEESITNSQFAKDWRTASRILKLAGSGGAVSAVAVAAIFANRTVEEVERAQASYAENFQDGARQAKTKGSILEKQAVPLSAGQHHALFVVGGATGEEGRASDIRAEIERLAKEERADKEARRSRGETVDDYDHPYADYLGNDAVTRMQTFDIKKSDYDVPNEEKFDKKGKYRPEYLAKLGIEGVALGRPDLGIKAAILNRVTGGKPRGGNEDAVDIAAQLYAHARATRDNVKSLSTMTNAEVWGEVKAMSESFPESERYPVPKKKKEQDDAALLAQARQWLKTKGWVGTTMPNKEKPIRVIAYGHGGRAVKEAMELLHAMGDPDRQILDQITVAYISCPDFNFTKPRTKEVSFISNEDPFSRFNHRSPERVISGEKGGARSVENYFSSRDFQNNLSTWMGFGDWSRTQKAAAAQAREAEALAKGKAAAEARAKKKAEKQASKKGGAAQSAQAAESREAVGVS